MHIITLHLYSLNHEFNVGDELKRDLTFRVEENEEARITAVREVLGGVEDAMADVEQHPGIRLFRRLDPTAPGGVGYMAAAQLHDTAGELIMPVPMRSRGVPS